MCPTRDLATQTVHDQFSWLSAQSPLELLPHGVNAFEKYLKIKIIKINKKLIIKSALNRENHLFCDRT